MVSAFRIPENLNFVRRHYEKNAKLDFMIRREYNKQSLDLCTYGCPKKCIHTLKEYNLYFFYQN